MQHQSTALTVLILGSLLLLAGCSDGPVASASARLEAVVPATPGEAWSYRLEVQPVDRAGLTGALRTLAMKDLDAMAVSNVSLVLAAPEAAPYAEVLSLLMLCIEARISQVSVSETGNDEVLAMPFPRDPDPAAPSPTTDLTPTQIHVMPDQAGEGCSLRLGDDVAADLEDLGARLRGIHDTAEKRARHPVHVYGADEVQWRWVYRTLQLLREDGYADVNFAVGEDNRR